MYLGSTKERKQDLSKFAEHVNLQLFYSSWLNIVPYIQTTFLLPVLLLMDT